MANTALSIATPASASRGGLGRAEFVPFRKCDEVLGLGSFGGEGERIDRALDDGGDASRERVGTRCVRCQVGDRLSNGVASLEETRPDVNPRVFARIQPTEFLSWGDRQHLGRRTSGRTKLVGRGAESIADVETVGIPVTSQLADRVGYRHAERRYQVDDRVETDLLGVAARGAWLAVKAHRRRSSTGPDVTDRSWSPAPAGHRR